MNDSAPAPILWADPARQQAFQQWLASVSPRHGLLADSVRSASADASFRRYFRVDAAAGAPHASLIVMDAPPDKEDCRPFVRVGRLLDAGGVGVPHILEWDEAQGFMLLTDLGASTFLSTLQPDQPFDAGNRARYNAALDELVRIQAVAQPDPALPPYDAALLQREMDLFPEWYLGRLRGLTLDDKQREQLQATFGLIQSNVLSQATVLVHRDYHSRNLMADAADPQARLGVIDFQDAVWGPVTYDLVSLLRDAYVMWDEEVQLDYGVRFWEKARKANLPVPEDFGAFWRDVEWMGLQRHLKVAGIFARLTLRDGKPKYLADAPRFIGYIRSTASRYRELTPLLRLIDAIEGTTPSVGFAYGRI